MKLYMFSEYLVTWFFCKMSSYHVFIGPLALLSVLIFVVSARCVYGGFFLFGAGVLFPRVAQLLVFSLYDNLL